MDTPKKQSQLSIPVFREILKNTVRLTKIVWEERKGTVLLLALVFVFTSATPFIQSGARGLMINELVRNATAQSFSLTLALLVGVVIGARAIMSALFSVQGYLLRLFWFFMEEKFELLILKRKGEIDIAAHEDPKYNDLFNRITEQGSWHLKSFVDRQFYILQNLLEIGIAAIIIIFSKWWVFFVLLVGVLPELFVEMKYGRNIWGIHAGRAEIRRRYWDLHRHFNWLPDLVELKLFQNTGHFYSMIKNLFRKFQAEERASEKKKLVLELSALVFSQIAIAIAVIWFVIDVVQGNMQIGTLTFLLASISDLRQALSGFFGNLGRHYQDSLFVADVFRLIDMPEVIKKSDRGFVIPNDRTPEIVFENVSFTYPGTKTPVLQNFSLRIAPGEKVAIVGVNGAGKTTFVKLLCRFYDPTEGRILIDGRDLREVEIESWYRQLGIIFQDYGHYNLLAREAIAIGRTDVDPLMKKIKEAAEASEADAFIEEWEGGYDQMLGKQFTGGVEPSIGQWQKLALARAFFRDPRIMILDEPTSSIDAEAEAKIFEKLEALPEDRSVILISHRFSTVRKAHHIVVIEDGEKKEYGNHKDLIKLDGTYARLFKLQAKGYE